MGYFSATLKSDKNVGNKNCEIEPNDTTNGDYCYGRLYW